VLPLLLIFEKLVQPEMGYLIMAEFSKDVPYDNSLAWKRLYETAVLELDNSKLPERMAEARRAIHVRAEEIVTHTLLAEHRLLNNALHALQILEAVAAREKPSAQSDSPRVPSHDSARTR
jgi:hypothetical protein